MCAIRAPIITQEKQPVISEVQKQYSRGQCGANSESNFKENAEFYKSALCAVQCNDLSTQAVKWNTYSAVQCSSGAAL